MAEVMCFGEPMVGFFTRLKEGKTGSFEMAIGGDTSNVALGVNKLGHPSSYLTRIGNDFFGNAIVDAWKQGGVDLSNVITDDVNGTGIYLATYDSRGGHQFFYKRKGSAASFFSVKDTKLTNFEGIRIFHLSGISQAISRSCMEASYELLSRCSSEKIRISYDLNYREALWSRDLFRSTALYTIRNFASLLSLTEEEAALLGFQGDPEEIVRTLLSEGPEYVGLKLGSRGCVIGTEKEIIFSNAFETRVVDTTGAGDAFTSAFIVAVLEGMETGDMAFFANAVASAVCGSVGSTSGQPSRNEIEAFIQSQAKGLNK